MISGNNRLRCKKYIKERMRIFMKKFVKKSVAAICSAAMLSGGAYPLAANAEETALRPEISGSWQET